MKTVLHMIEQLHVKSFIYFFSKLIIQQKQCRNGIKNLILMIMLLNLLRNQKKRRKLKKMKMIFLILKNKIHQNPVSYLSSIKDNQKISLIIAKITNLPKISMMTMKRYTRKWRKSTVQKKQIKRKKLRKVDIMKK